MRHSVTRHLLVDLKSLFSPWLLPLLMLIFLTPAPSCFYCDIQCRVMLTKAKMELSSINFLGDIDFSLLLLVAKFRILHCIYH